MVVLLLVLLKANIERCLGPRQADLLRRCSIARGYSGCVALRCASIACLSQQCLLRVKLRGQLDWPPIERYATLRRGIAMLEP